MSMAPNKRMNYAASAPSAMGALGSKVGRAEAQCFRSSSTPRAAPPPWKLGARRLDRWGPPRCDGLRGSSNLGRIRERQGPCHPCLVRVSGRRPAGRHRARRRASRQGSAPRPAALPTGATARISISRAKLRQGRSLPRHALPRVACPPPNTYQAPVRQ
jgi:hypothetical protein